MWVWKLRLSYILTVVFFALAASLFPLCVGAVSTKSETTVWIDAEDVESTNFKPGITVMAAENGASGGLYLRLESKESADHVFYAEYQFRVPVMGEYTIWVASSPQNTGWASYVSCRVDNQSAVDMKGTAWQSPAYGLDHCFGWFCAGTLVLSADQHTLRLEVANPRSSDSMYVAFLDTIVLTTDPDFRPIGNHPEQSPHPSWSDLMGKMTVEEYVDSLTYPVYAQKIKATREDIGLDTSSEVLRKIMARPLPKPDRRIADRRFGLHGMEAPFVNAGDNDEQTSKAFELLARAGVQTFRTAESCWHRLGENFDDFKELDYQVANAEKYGQTFMFTIGYPDPKFNVAPVNLSACKPEYYPLYRDYLQTVFNRYKNKHIIDYAELANEVDAPHVWWRGATPQMYVDEMKMVKEEVKGVDPNIKIVAFGATYSRDEKKYPKPLGGGRDWVRACFKLGIDKYVDAYSLHYTQGSSAQDFVAFFRKELKQVDSSEKPLINSEESKYERPSDVVKCFARDFFLYDMKRVDYYLARDWFENGNLLHGGLFDLKWQPKLRLLAYAMSVDAMKDRHLIGIAEPQPGIEAYVLEFNAGFGEGLPPYSIVLWKDGEGPIQETRVSGFQEVVSAVSWRLDPIDFNMKNPVFQISNPIAVFANDLPVWKLYTPAQWFDLKKNTDEDFTAPIPIPVK